MCRPNGTRKAQAGQTESGSHVQPWATPLGSHSLRAGDKSTNETQGSRCKELWAPSSVGEEHVVPRRPVRRCVLGKDLLVLGRHHGPLRRRRTKGPEPRLKLGAWGPGRFDWDAAAFLPGP